MDIDRAFYVKRLKVKAMLVTRLKYDKIIGRYKTSVRDGLNPLACVS